MDTVARFFQAMLVASVLLFGNAAARGLRPKSKHTMTRLMAPVSCSNVDMTCPENNICILDESCSDGMDCLGECRLICNNQGNIMSTPTCPVGQTCLDEGHCTPQSCDGTSPCPTGFQCVNNVLCNPLECGGHCEMFPLCGGIAGFPCPDGMTCVDNPTDECDPQNGGADCGGICIDEGDTLDCSNIDCTDDSVCVLDENDKPQCVQSCGGVAGTQCQDGFDCVDDPNDECTVPPCAGICIESAAIDCSNVECVDDTVCVMDENDQPQCVPFCGGVNDVQCDDGFECVDNPNDPCDPTQGDTNCGGYCSEAPRQPAPDCSNTECADGSVCFLDENNVPVCFQICGGVDFAVCQHGFDCREDLIEVCAAPPCGICVESPPLDCSNIDCFDDTVCIMDENDEPQCVPFCGGVNDLQCDDGFECVDNPNDPCDPTQGDANCGGYCVDPQQQPPTIGCPDIECPDGTVCKLDDEGLPQCFATIEPTPMPTPAPDTTPQFCGGIAGIPCPDGFDCVDDPNDVCDPTQGDADCGGICKERSTLDCSNVRCSAGTICVLDENGSPQCVPTSMPSLSPSYIPSASPTTPSPTAKPTPQECGGFTDVACVTGFTCVENSGCSLGDVNCVGGLCRPSCAGIAGTPCASDHVCISHDCDPQTTDCAGICLARCTDTCPIGTVCVEDQSGNECIVSLACEGSNCGEGNLCVLGNDGSPVCIPLPPTLAPTPSTLAGGSDVARNDGSESGATTSVISSSVHVVTAAVTLLVFYFN